jgi:hypothetical protein
MKFFLQSNPAVISLKSHLALLVLLSYFLSACDETPSSLSDGHISGGGSTTPSGGSTTPSGGSTTPSGGTPGPTVLTDEDVRNWTPQQIPDLETTQIQLLTPNQVRLLTSVQIQSFTAEQIQALGSDGSRASLRDLTQEQLAALNNNLSGLVNLTPLEQLTAFTVEQFETMSSRSRTYLPDLILYYYGHRIGSGRSDRRWTLEQVQALPLEHLSAVGFERSEMQELFLHISHFSVEQIAAICPQYLRLLWSLPLFSIEQIQALTVEQIRQLSAKQLQLLSITQVQALSDEQKQAINLNQKQVRGLNASFIQALLPEMTAEFILAMEGHEITALGGHGRRLGNLEAKAVVTHCALLSRDQLRAIAPQNMALFGSVDIASLGVGQIRDLLPEQIEQIDSDVFSSFTVEQIPHFTEEQIHSFTTTQITAAFGTGSDATNVRLNALTRQQIGYFKPEQLAGLSTDTLENILTPARVSCLVQGQIQALSTEQISRLFATGRYAAKQRLNALTHPQIQFFRGARLAELTHDSLLNFMTAAIIRHLSAEQVRALSVQQIRYLGNGRVRRQAFLGARPNYMTQNQRQALQ